MTADGNNGPNRGRHTTSKEPSAPKIQRKSGKKIFWGRTHRPTQALNLPCNLATPTIPAAFPVTRTVVNLFFKPCVLASLLAFT
jgi:hypothetical protein